ncbi:hypothetical protein NE237_023048 [Protea cynaroides]|uniref:non-specific serine/threonine protein kinase n=1 Tax=Protea cynaroides TaxID=273540 RepID=A0A9Q0K433_9MAGN|nr:hypothetical protein NE237_023048 [Protea cynaroides]
MEKYELVRDIGGGTLGFVKLMMNKKTGDLVAVKFIDRGYKIDDNVIREIINHRSLRHPHIIQFKEVVLTPTHLATVTEYASGGELFERICNAGRFTENEARYFFQQLISGVSYCHSMQICHKDLKLENMLIDKCPVPRLKLCGFRFSMSSQLHSRPKTLVVAPEYVAPEVLSDEEYDGMIADVWSCGVALYVILTGEYPFEDPEDPDDLRKTIARITTVQYKIPSYIYLTQACKQLLSGIFVADPSKRITITEIKNHPWFLKNLPRGTTESVQAIYPQKDSPRFSLQSEEEIMKMVEEARTVPSASRTISVTSIDELKMEFRFNDESDKHKRWNKTSLTKSPRRFISGEIRTPPPASRSISFSSMDEEKMDSKVEDESDKHNRWKKISLIKSPRRYISEESVTPPPCSRSMSISSIDDDKMDGKVEDESIKHNRWISLTKSPRRFISGELQYN